LPACLGIHPLRVSPFTNFQRSIHKYLNETIIADHVPALASCHPVRAHSGAYNYAVVTDDFGGHKADAKNVGITIFLAKAEFLGKVRADDIAVQQRHRSAVLHQQNGQDLSECRLTGTT
jgi:hypothetical protein